jgi:transcriptional regulator with XRE-family HTH domain
MNQNTHDFGKLLKRQRVTISLTLKELANRAGVSASHLGRIERGERFPSAHILRRIAKPLGFDEEELFTLAGFLSPQMTGVAEKDTEYVRSKLDPYVAKLLSDEPVEVQRTVIGILAIIKSLAKSLKEKDRA